MIFHYKDLKKNSKCFYQILVIVLLYIPISLFAGNEKSVFLGNNAALTAGSIVANIRDSESIYYNPAGLGGMIRTRINLSGKAFLFKIERVKKFINTRLPDRDLPIDIELNSFTALPVAVCFGRDITKKIAFGFGIFVPDGGDSSIKLNSSYESATINYKEVMEIYHKNFEYNIGPGLGIEILPNFRIGFGLFIIYTTQKENIFYLLQGIPNPTDSFVSSSHYQRNLVGILANFGIQWEVTKKFHLGFVIKSPNFNFLHFGNQSYLFSGSVDYNYEEFNEWMFKPIKPTSFQLAFTYGNNNIWVGSVLDLQHSLREDSLGINRKFLWNLSVGSKFKIIRDLYGGIGLFTDNSPNREKKVLGSKIVNYYGVTFGFDWSTLFKLDKGESFKSLRLISTFAVRYAIGIGKYGGREYDVTNEIEEFVYRKSINNEISLTIGSSFAF